MPSYSGLYDGHYGVPYARLPQTVNKGNAMHALAREFGRRSYGRGVVRELLQALTGAAVGGAYTLTQKRVKWTPLRGEPATGGGLVQLETYSLANTVTTSADELAIDDALEMNMKPSYPRDRAGNGGGSKLGY